MGKDAGHPQPEFPIMCDKNGRCKLPGCKGTPKVMCKKCKVLLEVKHGVKSHSMKYMI